MTTPQKTTGILELRKLRKRVRTTLNLVAGGHRLTARPGSWWAANLKTGEVTFTSTLPFPPHARITDRGIRMLCTHEGSHPKWSGLYTTKRIPAGQRKRFHRFYNAIEDIRVDRLSAKQFGTYRELDVEFRQLMRRQHGNHPQGWSLVDAVGLNAKFSLDMGLEPEGTDLAKEASKRLWPRLSRIANLRSSQEVATALEPIFLELVAIERAEEERKRREEEERRRREEEERQRREQERREEEERQRAEQQAAEEASQAASDDVEEQEDPDDANSEQKGDPSPGAESEDEPETDAKGDGDADDADDAAESSESAEDSEDADDVDDDAGAAASDERLAEDAEDAEDSGSAVDGDEDAESDPEQEGVGDGQGDEQDADAGDDPQDTEPEPEPEPDPLEGLDSLPEVGADEPTDTPIVSDGDPDTAPLASGEDIAGMAEDATDDITSNELRRLAQANQNEKAQRHADEVMQFGRRTVPTQAGIDSYHDKLAEWRGRINVLTLRLKTVLRHNSMANPLTGQRRGRFDPGKAYRLRTGSIHVFTKPGTVGGTDYNFGLLIDTSHSMWSNNRREINATYEATVLVAEALERAGLGVFLILWDAQMRHVKPIREPLAQHRGSVGTVMSATSGGSETVESPAIARAIDEFEQVGGKRMLITITDGKSDTIAESKELLEELEAMGVRCCTIRIGGPPGAHYQRGFEVAHADELTKLLPQLINEVVTRIAA